MRGWGVGGGIYFVISIKGFLGDRNVQLGFGIIGLGFNFVSIIVEKLIVVKVRFFSCLLEFQSKYIFD